ncbi:MAG: aminoacyl-histidine dipeptidase [Lautropia sp.]|nr:aminoacyl-histidine dipeptidase [Lautropia sp.]
MSTILDLQPQAVWRYFHQLTQIPRPSHHETAVQQYVLDEAARLGLEAVRDEAGNIRVRKPASSGHEQAAGVILQAHLDMVPQKNVDKVHDFVRDPITTKVRDDGWVTADGTTLGADNGIGAALILAVLADANLQHPPLEALFTATEETGMLGALGLQPNWLNGRYLINLDYEDEGELCIGCAGGLDGSFSVPYATRTAQMPAYRLQVRGLRGGHSGVDIHRNRGNAIRILAQALVAIGATDIAELSGGNLRNAIPREAHARIGLPDGMAAAEARRRLAALVPQINGSLNADDQGLALTLEADGDVEQVIDDSRRLLDVLRALPDGVDRMSATIDGLVETSTNLAAIRCEDGALQISCLLRSSSEAQKADLANRMESVLRLAGGQAVFDGDYGGWQPQPDSVLVNVFQRTGELLFGHEPPVKAIHAGLECGILSAHYQHWQMISFGPTITGAHSPDEAVRIDTVGRCQQWLQMCLQELAASGGR